MKNIGLFFSSQPTQISSLHWSLVWIKIVQTFSCCSSPSTTSSRPLGCWDDKTKHFNPLTQVLLLPIQRTRVVALWALDIFTSVSVILLQSAPEAQKHPVSHRLSLLFSVAPSQLSSECFGIFVASSLGQSEFQKFISFSCSAGISLTGSKRQICSPVLSSSSPSKSFPCAIRKIPLSLKMGIVMKEGRGER